MKNNPTEALVDIYLKELKLPGIRASYGAVLRETTAEAKGPLEFLCACLAGEIETRQANRFKARLKQARFPNVKSLFDYNFSAMPKLDKLKVTSLCAADFVEEKENVVLIGLSGTGKTHIATAIGLGAIEAGRRVRFVGALTLCQELELARAEHRLPKYLKSYDKYDLVIIDELGYLGLGAGGQLLFQFMAERYERRSVVITTNLEFGRWVEVFSDTALTTALLDRLTHHCHVVVFDGDSYRFKQSQKAAEDHKKGRSRPKTDDGQKPSSSAPS